MISFGSAASARAIATRCCSPPESSARQMIDQSSETDEFEVVLGAVSKRSRLETAASEVERQHRVLERRQGRQQLEELEHDPTLLATPDRQLLLTHLVQESCPSTETVPAVARSIPVIMFMIVVLPLPDGPTIRHHLAGVDRKVDPAKGRVLELPRPIDLHDRLELDQGLSCSRAGAGS